MKVSAIIAAAGKGKRLGQKLPKALVRIQGKPLIIYTLEALAKAYPFKEVIVAADPESLGKFCACLKHYGLSDVRVVPGGKTRGESVRNALNAANASADLVLIHDAARPLVSAGLVRRVIEIARKSKAAIAALPAHETAKRVDPKNGVIQKTEDRQTLYFAQTPQVFSRNLLLERYRALGKKAFDRTDDAALFDGTRVRVAVVPGERRNIKITTPEDTDLFNFYLEQKDAGDIPTCPQKLKRIVRRAR